MVPEKEEKRRSKVKVCEEERHNSEDANIKKGHIFFLRSTVIHIKHLSLT